MGMIALAEGNKSVRTQFTQFIRTPRQPRTFTCCRHHLPGSFQASKFLFQINSANGAFLLTGDPLSDTVAMH
jgi:hypothetical protein